LPNKVKTCYSTFFTLFQGTKHTLSGAFNNHPSLVSYGLPPRWIVWVRGILSSASSAVLLNGVPGKYLKCKRGVRQGDPLSPLLFVLASELLQILVNKAANINLLKAPIPQPTTNFPIVQYADDTLSNSPSRCTTVGLSQSPPTQLYRVDGSKGWNGVFLPVLHGYLTRGI
jgi:hypothetical protein